MSDFKDLVSSEKFFDATHILEEMGEDATAVVTAIVGDRPVYAIEDDAPELAGAQQEGEVIYTDGENSMSTVDYGGSRAVLVKGPVAALFVRRSFSTSAPASPS